MTNLVPEPQAIVNHIVGILNTTLSEELTTGLSLQFHNVPLYEQITMSRPAGHVFAERNDLSEVGKKGSENVYFQTLQLTIVVVLPGPDANTRDRPGHRFEQGIKRTVLRAQTQPSEMPDGSQLVQIRYSSSDYTIREDDQVVTDRVDMIFEVDWSEIIE